MPRERQGEDKYGVFGIISGIVSPELRRDFRDRLFGKAVFYLGGTVREFFKRRISKVFPGWAEKGLVLLLACLMFVIPIASSANASFLGLLGPQKEKTKEVEIKDDYLVGLFTPDMPYETVKVLQDNDGTKLIEVNFKSKVTEQMVNQYNNLLLSRSVIVYATYHYGLFSWQTSAGPSAISITRKAKGKPDTIEVSESELKKPFGDPRYKNFVDINPVRIFGKTIEFKVVMDFGKSWKKVKLIPEKATKLKMVDETGNPKLIQAEDMKVPRPPIKYPGSKLVKFTQWGSITEFYIYVVKGMPYKTVVNYFHEEMRKIDAEMSPSLNWDKFIEQPSMYRYPLDVLGLKTVGVYVIFDMSSGGWPVSGTHATIRFEQSNDPNLFGYTIISYEIRPGIKRKVK